MEEWAEPREQEDDVVLPRSTRRRSDVWQFMVHEKIHIRCTLCNSRLPTQSKCGTSGLRSHLLKYHPDKYTRKFTCTNNLRFPRIKQLNSSSGMPHQTNEESTGKLQGQNHAEPSSPQKGSESAEASSADLPGTSKDVSPLNHSSANAVSKSKPRSTAYHQLSAASLARKKLSKRLYHSQQVEEKRGLINDLIFNMIVEDLLPVNIVEGDGFQKLLHILEKGYTTPTKAYLEGRLQKMLKVGRQKLEAKFGGKQVGLTLKLWSGYSNRIFITLTATTISSEWASESWLLGTIEITPRMTEKEIANHTRSLCQSCGIADDAIVGLVYGSESRQLGGDTSEGLVFLKSVCTHLDWECRPCLGQLLTISLQNALSIPPVSELIHAGEGLISHVTAQTDIQQKLSSVLEERKQEPALMVCDVSSKWQMICTMFSQLSELREPIADNLECQEVNLTGQQWKFLHEVLGVLCSMKAAFAIVSDGRNKPVSCWLPVVHKVLQNIETGGKSGEDVSENGQIFIFALATEIQARCELSEVPHSSYVMQATAVDPRFHHLHFLSAEDRASVGKTIKSKLRKQSGEPETNSTSSVGKEGSAFFDLFGEDEFNIQNIRPEDEIDRFCLERPVSRETDPLKWWHLNEKRFSALSGMAKSVLCIPALASTLSESGEAGDGSHDWKRLKSVQNVDAQLFLHHNVGLFREDRK